MANDNNNINQLVAEDDDPTAELEILSFSGNFDDTLEADAKTFDADKGVPDDSELDATVSALHADLEGRQERISKLQFDLEQLQSKWLGLEAEINARQGQSDQLRAELQSSKEVVTRKQQLVKKRDQRIRSLKAEIRQRDKAYRDLTADLEEANALTAELSETLETAEQKIARTEADLRGIEEFSPIDTLRQKLQHAESYADELRQQLQDAQETNANLEREISAAAKTNGETQTAIAQLTSELQDATETIATLQSQLDSVQSTHDEEIRILRFELGAAEDTIVESADLSSQLASDLVDAQAFKEALEHELGQAEQQTVERIDKMQRRISDLEYKIDSYEQKLTTKSDAIAMLLTELAKKSEQIESIGEIENVIHDIDERMSEKSLKHDGSDGRPPAARMFRVLVGNVDGQVLRFPLFKDRLTVGRTSNNDIQLKAAYVSRRHAVIQTDGESTRIIDWGSKNGIHVNSARITEHFLNQGDIITIGNATFRYEERRKRDS